MKKIFLLMTLSLIMTGCSLIPKTQAPEPKSTISWEEHQTIINQISHWNTSGKIGIRTSDDSQSASLSWNQNQQAYNISLKGPLGQGGATISGDQYSSTLEIPGEQPLAAGSPEELLSLRLGWEIPVKDAQYWIKGVPSPNSDYDLTLTDNRLTKLTQQGWNIEYQSYVDGNKASLPRKLTMSREELKLTLILRNWRIID
ncbi:MAG: lipoprotein insertase outer membrane protein LolB [Pseudomonadales bacterium]